MAILRRKSRMSLKLMMEMIMRDSTSSITILCIFSVIIVSTMYESLDSFTTVFNLMYFVFPFSTLWNSLRIRAKLLEFSSLIILSRVFL